MVIEAPYDTENTWTLTFDEDAQRNYSWRDKGGTNAGHIVVSSSEKCRITVWWSAGDDFSLSMFFGVPKTLFNDWAYRWSDTHSGVQARMALEITADDTDKIATHKAKIEADTSVPAHTQMDEP